MINGCNVDNVEEWNDDRMISCFSAALSMFGDCKEKHLLIDVSPSKPCLANSNV